MPFACRSDARIWRDQSGTGGPVLLITGHACGAGRWHRTAPGLAASCRVIRFGNRWAGRSSGPPGPCPVRLRAEDALAVLDAAGAASAHVHGVPPGGAIALQLALDHPGRPGEIRVPTLVMHGARDRIVPAASARRLAGSIAGARLVMFPGAGHAYITDVARAANQEVLDFLPGIPGPAGASVTGPSPAASTADT